MGRKRNSESGREEEPTAKQARADTSAQLESNGSSDEAANATPLPISHPFQQRFCAPDLADGEFHVLDETTASDEECQSVTPADDLSDVDVDEDELMDMLDAGLPEKFRERRGRGRARNKGNREQGTEDPLEEDEDNDKNIDTREKVVLMDKGRAPVEPLPEGWVQVTHESGVPLYIHKPSRVVATTRVYFLGPGSVRKHDIPLYAIPCLNYLRELEKEASSAAAAGKVSSEQRCPVAGATASGKVSSEQRCPVAGATATSDTVFCNGAASEEEISVSAQAGSAQEREGGGRAGGGLSATGELEGNLTGANHVDHGKTSEADDTGDQHSDSTTLLQAERASPADVAAEPTEPAAAASDSPRVEPGSDSQSVDASAADGADVQTASVTLSQPQSDMESATGENVEESRAGSGAGSTREAESPPTSAVALDSAGAAGAPPQTSSTGAPAQTPAPPETNGEGEVAQAKKDKGHLPAVGNSIHAVDPSLSASELNQYCRKRFHFKTIQLLKFTSWRERRDYAKKKRIQQRPQMDSDTKLFRFPIPPNRASETTSGHKRPRDWVVNPGGKSYVCLLHEYLQHVHREQPYYTYCELESATTPYGATVSINGVNYGTGCGTSKKTAKADSARVTLNILIPKLMSEIGGDSVVRGNTKPADIDLAFFDTIRVEDPRVMDLCSKAGEPSPYTILLTCLQRNFGMDQGQVACTVHADRGRNNNEFEMTVGKHCVRVRCKNKKDGKHVAAQAMLQQLHPHVNSWGSLLRMYGNHAMKPLKVKRHEELQVTTLQSRTTQNSPNLAILAKLRLEMNKLQQAREKVRPIGRLQLTDVAREPNVGSCSADGAAGLSEVGGEVQNGQPTQSASGVNLDVIDL